MILLKFLGSLTLAIFLIGSLTLILVISTLLESAYGTPFAQKFFYQAGWFDVFLGLLAVNIFCSAALRFPYKRKHTGFVTTHAGILLLLGGSLLSRLLGVEGQMMLWEGEGRNEILQNAYQIVAHNPGKIDFTADLTVSAAKRPPFRLGRGLELQVHRVLENAAEHNAIEEGKENAETNHAVEVTLASEMAGFRQTLWLVEKSPLNPHSFFVTLGPAFLELRDKSAGPQTASPSLTFYFEGEKWSYESVSSKGRLTGEVVAGATVPTGWMDFTFQAGKLLNRAVVSKGIKAAPEGQKGQMAANVSLSKEGETLFRGWLLAEQPRSFSIADTRLQIAIREKRVAVPFSLVLKDFRKVDYPGTNRPASYESDVVLEDPKENLSIHKTISMNKPLDYKGFRIFQSSFAEDPEFGEASVFAIAKNPGITFIYSGACVLFAGVFLLFFVKPFSSLQKGEAQA
ncbi:MAG: cytochrome c biogenesis protein ResB [Candidatus Omnitrophota bacterium]